MEKISDFRGLHKGKNLFILASGPSLKTLDLTPLRRRLVMGLNRSFLIFPGAYYHCVMDQRLFDEYPDQLHDTRYLFTTENRPWGIPLNFLGGDGFSWDLEHGIYSGYTISYFALQVAVYMGFQKIFYLGLDLQHRGANTHFFGFDFRSENHEKTEFPRMNRMLSYAAKKLADTDVEVFNCSPVSTLECFPKITYEDALSY